MKDAELIAAAIQSREAYEKVRPFIDPKDMTPAGGFWWELIGEWYARDRTTKSVDRSSLGELGNTRIPNSKLRDTITGFLRDLPDDVSPANASQVALELKRHNVGMELAGAIASSDQKKLTKLVPQYTELYAATELKAKGKQAQYEDAAAIEELFSKVGQENRVPLYPSRLNDRIAGGALPGHHVVLFGRPEIGKSTISINLATMLAIKGNQRVLYIGNEDQINIIKARAVSRATGLTSAEIEADLPKATALFRERGGEERLRFIQAFDTCAADLRQPIEEFEPTVLVLDQIRNLASADSDGITARLEENGQAVRRLLLEYKLIGVSVAQAGGSAEGKNWLSMNDLDSSKTGLPGTADLMIGIGADATHESRNQRCLSFPKNKLSSAPNAHEGVVVDVDRDRCSVK